VNVEGEKRSQWWKLVKQLSRYRWEDRQAMLSMVPTKLGLADDWKAEYVEGTGKARRFWLLTANQLRELSRSGMTVGAHTSSHPVLSQMAEESAHAEISQSRVGLGCFLQQDIWAFAYPFGDADSVTSREVKLAEKSGFSCAFMNFGGGFGADIPRFVIPRMHVTSDMSLGEFEAHLSGFHRSLRQPWIRLQETVATSNHGTERGH
jgi:peptidoglycan/xylan/chitin deacetylase (PgdA/CDA1 family)